MKENRDDRELVMTLLIGVGIFCIILTCLLAYNKITNGTNDTKVTNVTTKEEKADNYMKYCVCVEKVMTTHTRGFWLVHSHYVGNDFYVTFEDPQTKTRYVRKVDADEYMLFVEGRKYVVDTQNKSRYACFDSNGNEKHLKGMTN